MTRDEAVHQVQQFFAGQGAKSEGLNARGQGGVSMRETDTFFLYEPELGALRCSALIYRFKGVPRPEVVGSFEQEAKGADTGGGALEYDPEARAFMLTRRYTAPVPAERFQADLFRLMDQSVVWAREKVAAIAARANAASPQRIQQKDPFGF